MAITTYSGLLVELTRLIDGEDVSGSEIPTDTLSTIVHFGELRIYREAKVRQLEKAFTGTVTGNLFPIPADFMSSSIAHFGGKPLDPKAENELIERIANNPGGGGDTKYYAQAGNNFMFWPAVENGTALQGRYFARLPDLQETTILTNALFLANEDLFIYAALAISAPYFGQDARIPMWEAQYQRILAEVNVMHHRSAYSSGRIVRSVNSKVIG
jgi:hypothetical protein